MDQGRFKNGGGGFASGLFKHDDKGPDISKELEGVSSVLKDLMRRVRILEERYSNIRRVIQVNEENMLKENKRSFQELKSLGGEISELKKLIRSMGDELRLIVADLKESVKKDELKVLENYLNLWEPVNFVSHKELEGLVDRLVEKKLKEKAGTDAQGKRFLNQ